MLTYIYESLKNFQAMKTSISLHPDDLKKICFPFIAVFLTFLLSMPALPQAPPSFSYQAVARDKNGDLLKNVSLDVRLSILQGSETGTAVWSETQTVTTNDLGLFTLQAGSSTPVDVGWSGGPYYLKVEVDLQDGNGFQAMGTVKLLSVPYALYAKDAANKDDADADPQNEIQDLQLNGNLLSLTLKGNPTIIDLSTYLDNTDEQTLGVSGHTLTIAGGNAVQLPDTVNDADHDPANEIQDLQLIGNILTITNNGSATSIDLSPYLDNPGWNKSGDTLTYAGSVGIGTDAVRGSRLAVQGDDLQSDSALFVVKRKDGQPVFSVYNKGVRIYVDASATAGPLGEFSVRPVGAAAGSDEKFFTVSGLSGSGTVNDKDGALWYSEKKAFRTGQIRIESPDSVGEYSFASGYRAKAVGLYSQAMGYNSVARGDYSTAMGYSIASAKYSTALGGSNVSGIASTAMGLSVASGDYSTAMGYHTTAGGSFSTATGTYSNASGDYSTAMGRQTSASGANSTAMGTQTAASGAFSTAAGTYSKASGDYSTAMGRQTYARGANSTAMGYLTNASGANSTAIGYYTNASGSFATAAGTYSNASGNYSTAMGYGTVAQAYGSFVLGRYNFPYGSKDQWLTGDPLFVIGNGTTSSSRSNAMVVCKNGYTRITAKEAYEGLFVENYSGSGNISCSAIRGAVTRNGTGIYYSGFFYDVGSGGTYNGLYADVRSGASIDIAEYIYDTNGDTESGDIVVADPAKKQSVLRSSAPYQASCLGVVSTNPHLTMGMELVTDEKTGEEIPGVQATRLALNGRVPVKVTDENGPIIPGDLITTSSTPGYGMKWTLIDVSKAKDFEDLKKIMAENEKRRNAIIGKAVEALPSGSGKILVLITLQ